MKIISERLFSLFSLEANIETTTEKPSKIYLANPLDLVSAQNHQVVTNQHGPLKHLPLSKLSEVAQVNRSISAALADIDEQDLSDLIGNEIVFDAQALEDVALRTPIVRLVDVILNDAYSKRATDIHFDPTESGVRIRFRIDGILYDQPSPPKYLYPAIVSRIKIVAGMDIAEKRLPQDGRIRTEINNRIIDIRVATVPSVYGESISLRLLDKWSRVLSLHELGLSQKNSEVLSKALSHTNGIILATGPTY